MDREYKKGQRLHIDTRDFSFEGTVCFTDPAHDMLSLANVIYRPSGKQRFSRINVFRVDVKRSMYGVFMFSKGETIILV